MANKRISVALFGLGRAGHIHFGNLIRNFRVHLKYIVEMDTQKAQKLVDLYHLTETIVVSPSDADIVYNDNNLRAVVVCTPTYTHEENVRNSLKHGKAVFCEKPIAEDIHSTRLCYEEADAAGQPLLCSFNRRFDPSVSILRSRVQEGEFGKVHMVKTCSRDHPLPPLEYLKISGGMFHDCAVHDIDMVCWILDEWPERVYTQAHAHLKEISDLDDVDTVAIIMNFPSGVIATIDLSRHASYGYEQRLEVFGSGGMIISGDQRPTGVVSYSNKGTNKDCLKYSFPQRYADSYINSLDHFLDVVEGKGKPSVSAEETLRCTQIATACEESHRQKKPIDLVYELPKPASRQDREALTTRESKSEPQRCADTVQSTAAQHEVLTIA